MTKDNKIDYNYGIENSLNLFEKIKLDGQKMISSAHPFEVFNFVITVWHLHNDWLPKEIENYSERVPELMEKVFTLICAIANGSKHYNLYTSNVEKYGKRVSCEKPGIRNWTAFFSGRNQPDFKIDGIFITLQELHNIIIFFFEWVFNDQVDLESFPAELQELLCQIQQRAPNKN